MTLPSISIEPALPRAVGPLSSTILDTVRRGRPALHVRPIDVPVCDADPYGLDLQLALYVCYELHYRGFAGSIRGGNGIRLSSICADASRTRFWAPFAATSAKSTSMTMRRGDGGDFVEPVDGDGRLITCATTAPGSRCRSTSCIVRCITSRRVILTPGRSPASTGQAKAAFVAVEYDEYGAGRGDQVHQHLFAELMDAAGLDATYLGYLDDVPADALASVNLMSLFGLHRELRGAAIGHFASTEITSSPGSRRLVDALQRMDAPQPCVAFYAEHIVADAVHEQVVRTDVVGDLVVREPHLEADVVFGIRARDLVEDRLADHLMACWTAGRSSLRRPLS